MTIADEARDSALHCEMKKHFLRQSKDGVVVSFVVHPQEIPHQLQVSDIGSRWMVALVQIGDDELPVHQPAKEKSPDSVSVKPLPESDKPLAGAKREKMDWRDVQPAAQAGIRCDDAVFHAFLKEQYSDDWAVASGDAAVAVRLICNIKSRAELGAKHAARVIWHQLDSEFLAWKAVEHA